MFSQKLRRKSNGKKTKPIDRTTHLTEERSKEIRGQTDAASTPTRDLKGRTKHNSTREDTTINKEDQTYKLPKRLQNIASI